MEGLLHMNCCPFQKQIHSITNIVLWPAQLNLLMIYNQQLTTYIVMEGAYTPSLPLIIENIVKLRFTAFYFSGHTDCVITTDDKVAEAFLQQVDRYL